MMPAPYYNRRKALLTAAATLALLSSSALCACASAQTPVIDFEAATPAVEVVEVPPTVTVVEIPTPLPLPAQMKAVEPTQPPAKPAPAMEQVRKANAEARMEPVHEGFINAIQIYPYTAGALYQVYTAIGHITDITLQPGEQLVGAGPIASGDTVRWIIADTESGTGNERQVHILVKPTRADMTTNLIINTDRRTYYLELRSATETYMASVSWQYPQDQIIALKRQALEAKAAQPVATGIDPSRLDFRYQISGDQTPWRPLQVFDDGQQVFIAFPPNIAQGELPPLFVIGADNQTSELVNYRVRDNYMIVDRLFAAAELRLGNTKRQNRVRITRKTGGRL